MREILSIDPKVYKGNAELIAHGVAPMGYIRGSVLDLTYGEGTFWKLWGPMALIANDLDPDKGDFHEDFRHTPWANASFDTVVLDPPYKLQGTPSSGEMDRRFGTTEYRQLAAIEKLHVEGCTEAARLSREYVLVKTMAQVSGGRSRWLPDLVSETMRELHCRKVTQFFLVGHRAQPKTNPDGSPRRQVTPRNNYSQLLVFEVPL